VRRLLVFIVALVAFAPQGAGSATPQRIVYTEQEVGASDVAFLTTIAADGSGKRRLLGHEAVGYPHHPVWSPDGRWIAFGASVSPRWPDAPLDSRLYVVGADGSGLHEVTPTLGAWSPVWSPDGDELAFTRYSDQGVELRVVSADGTGERVVAGGADPTWSPRGDELAFTAGPSPLAVRIAGAGGVRDLAPGAAGPAWSPDGRWIAFFRGMNLWLVHPDGTGRRQVAAKVLPGTVWTPDGKRVGVWNLRSSNLRLVPVSGGKSTTVVRGKERLLVWADFSPDGRRLVLQRDRRIEVVATAGGVPRQIATGSFPDWSP
jgi:Tol biopolymer transport system component